MPDIRVHRHGDRWSVMEPGAESPSKEFPTREAAEMAARQLAAGGSVEVVEDDPTGLDRTEPGDAGEPGHGAGAAGESPEQRDARDVGGVGAPEGVRSRQPGL